MRREIGSEFWDIPVSGPNGLFPQDTCWFRSGRAALEAVLRENSFRTAALPFWCCDSMITPFLEAGIRVSFYSPGDSLTDADAALVLDYFGYTGHSPIGSFKGTVIRDVTHSLLSSCYDDADYCFGSLRKWAGFHTGGFAWGLKQQPRYLPEDSFGALRQRAMEEKQRYISGESESKDYLGIYAQAEDLLEQPGIYPAEQGDIALAHRLDVEYIRSRRRENAAILLDAVGDKAVFRDLKETDCPMFVPILTDRRDELRRHLIQNEIYCPVHWPVSPVHVLTQEQQLFYSRELSLVCDQRYDAAAMQRFVRCIKEFF